MELYKAVKKTLMIKPWYIALYFVVMIILILSSFIEYRARYSDILKLIQNQASVTAAVIAQSASGQAYMTEEIKIAYVDRANDLLNIINRIDAMHGLSATQLHEILTDNNIFQILLFNEKGELECTVTQSDADGKSTDIADDPWLLEQLQPLLNNQEEEVIAGVDADETLGSRFLVAIVREAGGTIACVLSQPSEEDYKYLTSIELALEDLLYVEGIQYLQITIDGGESFFVAREGIIFNDSWTREPLENILYRVSKGDMSLLEIVRPVFFSSSMGEVRIGFIADELLSLRSQIIYQLLLRTILLSLLAFLILIFLLTRHNAALLASEKKRIESEVYRLENLNRVNEKRVAMGELAAGVAHEIRNPLNAIGIVAQRLKREFSPETDSEEYLNLTGTMVSEIARINHSLQDFLEYTRPTPLRYDKINLQEMLNNISDLYMSQAQEKQVDLRFDSESIVFDGDDDLLLQALSNIIKNAIEACDFGGKVMVKGMQVGNMIRISIQDTGIGIQAENLNRIFDLYYTNKDLGTGVGLAITHKIIADHQGSIEVESEIDKGSKFEINIPAKR
ncbi:MAG: hypothetical protein K9N35_05185 [Candidatus Marinimicrobia bacterium]|nr:hypothetical protein [Candidatus Neomarinimicrobiota bacterium]